MVVDTTRQNISLSKIVGQKSENVVVEGDVIVPDIKPDILNVISTSGNICIYKKEVQDGKVRFDGCVQVSIIYLADNEEQSTRGMSTVIDFTKIVDFDGCKQHMNLSNQFKMKHIGAQVINGRKVSIKAELGLEVKVYTNEEVDLITQIDSKIKVQKLSHMAEVNLQVGSGTTKVYAKENLTLDEIDHLAEILRVDFRITGKDKKLSYNKVLAKADAEISILYLTEDNRMNKVEAAIPVMGFVDIQNISEENICDTAYELKNLVIKPNTEDGREIYVEAEIEISCDAFEKRQIEVTEDLYSPTQNLNFTQKQISSMSNRSSATDTYSIREKLPMQEAVGGRIYDIHVEANSKNIKRLNGRVLYDGEVSLCIMFANDMGIFNQKEANLPFNFSQEVQGLEEESNIDVDISVTKQDFVLLPEGMLECKIDLTFKVDSSNLQTIHVIDEITAEDRSRDDIYSMVIYFVKPGDTLWKIAKKFGSTVEDIARVNGIENVNMLQVARQLYIPRYSDKTA